MIADSARLGSWSRKHLWLAACSALSLGAGGAFAAEPGPAAEAPDSVLSEVIVTATRREERLQDVPISVTALSTENLEQKQVQDVITLAKVVPGLQVKTTFTPLEITTAIRGVTQYIPSINVDPPIGVYVDGVYFAINAGSNNGMIDMERVEVLKGPQGTLFGRNTIGGAISITTAKPKDDFSGYFEAAVGDYETYTGTGVVNLPLKPGVLAARVVFQHTEHGGYGRNIVTGNPTATFKQDYVRGSLKFTPTEEWDIVLTGFHADAKGFGPATRLTFQSPTFAATPLGPNNSVLPTLSGRPGDLITNYVNRGDFQDSYAARDNRYLLKQSGAVGTILGDFGPSVSVKSITGFTRTHYDAVTSLSGSPYTQIDVIGFPIKVDQFSEELQVYGKAFDDRLSWIAGAYYFRETGGQHNKTQGFPAVARAFGQPATYNVSGPDIKNKSTSAFAELTYSILPNLRLTGGVRHVVDRRNVTYSDHTETTTAPPAFITCALANAVVSSTARGDPNPANCVLRRSVRYSYTPWTVSLDYKPNDDTLLYAKVSKGYRSGAFSLGGPPQQAVSATVSVAAALAADAANVAAFGPVAPENLISPEVGFKVDAFDRRLRVNGALFYSRYNNVQVSVAGPAPCVSCSTQTLLLNSGKVENWGGELEARAILGKLQLDGAIGYTDPKYISGPFVGQPVINFSKFNTSVTGAYPIETGAGLLTLSATYSYRSKAYLNALNPLLSAAHNASFVQSGVSLLDAKATFALEGTSFLFAIYGQNLTNEEYLSSIAGFGSLGYTVAWPAPPRTVGASIRYSF